MLETGCKGHAEDYVTEENAAKSMGSGDLMVFATPAMIALVEMACWTSVADGLEEGQSTVGTALEVNHVSATPLGVKVWCDSELTQIDGRKLTFAVKVYDEAGLIGEGSHQRFIIDKERFLAKAEKKAEAKKEEV
ncbi:MAG: thioesterase family protein [Lachnospiraceae bacterium]|nr:thioesterase family protein [Lachnospiraceae bacterium]